MASAIAFRKVYTKKTLRFVHLNRLLANRNIQKSAWSTGDYYSG